MELFATIALLWRHRLLLIIGGVLSIAIGVKAMQGLSLLLLSSPDELLALDYQKQGFTSLPLSGD